MKQIVKGQEPTFFIDWKRERPRVYSDLGNPLKRELKEALAKEQFFLCCYCERRLDLDDSHIEHLSAQSENRPIDLVYGNLLCSCQDQLVRGEPRICGHAKGNETLPVTPLDPSCESRFKSTRRMILPAEPDDRGAEETINGLNLNAPILQSLRAAEVDTLAQIITSQSDPETKKATIAQYLSLNANGELEPFWTTIRYIFQGYL